MAESQRAVDEKWPRILGDVQGAPGPLLVAVAGLHGNEPAGVFALRRVFGRLQQLGQTLRGRFVGLTGNREALRRGVRFVDHDLNRAWSPSRPPPNTGIEVEAAEQQALKSILETLLNEAEGVAHCIDLHTISAQGAPFATLGDALKNRAFAVRFPVVKLLGIEEQIQGSMLEWVGRKGAITLGFEGGQHEDPVSVDRHESFIWSALESAELLTPSQIPDRELHRQRLVEASRGVPEFVEVLHRHPVAPEDGFRMEPGFRHFQEVASQTVLAHDRSGPVRAPFRGILLFPLYQGQGEDGFFMGRPVHPAWLKLSAWLRRSGAARMAGWLPGVQPGDPGLLWVDPRLARYKTTQLFHLLGYRRVRHRDVPGRYAFVRRLD